MLIKNWLFMPVWNAEGAGGGASGGAGDGGTGDGGAADDAAAAAAAAAAGDGGAGKWWEDARYSEDQRRHLTASGLTVDDPRDAVAKLTDMHRHAVTRLGKDPSQLLDRPKKDQPVVDWMKGNRDLFGLPETADGYKIEAPADWPKDAKWDTDFEAQAKAYAFENGIPPAALNGLVGLYAGKVAAIAKGAEDQYAAANDQMMAELTKEWGTDAPARMHRATQAAQAVAQKVGMSAEQVEGVARTLSAKGGDANVVKMFEAIGAMMGDDVMMGAGKGSGSFGTSPAEARQQIATLNGPGGDYYEATKSGDSARIAAMKPNMDQLYKLAAN